MKVVAFNGSPRKEGNTYFAIRTVLDELEKEGIETEIIHVGNKTVRGCLACNACSELRRCVIDSDEVNAWAKKMMEADGILLGAPVHYAGISGTMKSFLDRAFYISDRNALRYKVGASVVAVRRTGGISTFDQLNNYIHFSEMIMPGSNYWNVIHGTAPGEASQDAEGMQIMRILGKNMAWLMKSLEQSKKFAAPPEAERKVMTNFIH